MGNQSLLHGIAARHKHDGNGGGRSFCRQTRRRARGCNDVNTSAYQVSRQGRKYLILTFGRTIFERDVSAFDKPLLAETLMKRAYQMCRQAVGSAVQKPDDGIGLLLCMNRRWPCRQPAEGRDELASLHATASDARALTCSTT